MIAAPRRWIAAVRAWFAEELRLLALEGWDDGRYHGPPAPEPCTAGDPRCQRTLERLAEVGSRMARMKARVLDGRKFTSSAATDVRATILRAMSTKREPVRAVRRMA